MLLVDTADRELLRECSALPFLSGFTTNPTLVARAAGESALDEADYIRRTNLLLADHRNHPAFRVAMAQVVGDPSGWPEQARGFRLAAPPPQVLWVKVPATTDGLAACRMVGDAGGRSLVTAVFTPAQAVAAVAAGADGIAVYFGRMQRTDPLWEAHLSSIAAIQREAGRLLLLASISDNATLESALGWSRDLTVHPDVARDLLAAPLTVDALATFASAVTS